jgi:tryptophan-rich sensory protein
MHSAQKSPEGSHDAPWLAGVPLLALCAALLSGFYVWLHHLEPAPPPPEDRIAAWIVIFALYALSAWWVWRLRHASGGRARFAMVIVGAIVLHAVVLSGEAPPNPDIGRHLWEGRVLLEGYNPYAGPPESPVYDPLRAELGAAGDDLWSGEWLQYRHIRTVYGPVATALWSIPHLLPLDRILSLRLIMTLCSLGTVALLVALLAALGRGRALVIVFAWSPVCLNGFADRGQIDAAMVLLVVLATLLLVRRRPTLAGVAMTAALLTKLWPLLLALPMLRVGGRRFGAGLVLAGLAGVLPFAAAGPEALEGLGAFAHRWHSNDSVFTLVLMAAEALHLPAAGRIARGAVGLLAAGYALWRSYRLSPDDLAGLPGALAGISAAVIILSPVTYPWYTAPLVAFLCFAPVGWLVALSLAPMLWYLRFIHGDPGTVWAVVEAWGEKDHQAWRLPVYGAIYAAGVVAWLRSRADR